MIVLVAVFLYGCRVQREEVKPNNNVSSKNLSFLLKVKKWYDTKKMLKSRNDDVSIISSDYEPDFSASISQKIPCGSNSMFRIPFKDKNDSTKILKHQITKDGKIFTGIPELIIRQNDEDFTVVISVTSTNLENKDDLRENNFFTKSSHFTGVDYFFSPEGTSFLGANPYTNGKYNGELESITCIVICTINGGGSGGSGGVIPQSTGPARIVSVTQVKNTTTNMMTCTTSCIIGGTPTGGGSSGSNGSSGGSNIPSGGGGSGSNTPYNPPKDPTCPTGNCCGERNIPNYIHPELKKLLHPDSTRVTNPEHWKTLDSAFRASYEKSCIVKYIVTKMQSTGKKINLQITGEIIEDGRQINGDFSIINGNPKILMSTNCFRPERRFRLNNTFFEELIHTTQYYTYGMTRFLDAKLSNIEFEAKMLMDLINRLNDDKIFGDPFQVMNKRIYPYESYLNRISNNATLFPTLPDLINGGTSSSVGVNYPYWQVLDDFRSQFPSDHPYGVPANTNSYPWLMRDIANNINRNDCK